MNTSNISPQIVPPIVPDDFQFPKGTPAEIVRSIFNLLQSATITGIPGADQNFSFDMATLQTSMTTVQNQVKGITKVKKFFRVPLQTGTYPQNVTVPFGLDPMPTDNYSVDVIFSGPIGTMTGFAWAVVDGTKTINQVQVRIAAGAAVPTIDNYSIEVTVEEN